MGKPMSIFARSGPHLGLSLIAGALLSLASPTTEAQTPSPPYRLSGAVMQDFSSVPHDAASPSYRVSSRPGTAFHSPASRSTTWVLESGHPPLILAASGGPPAGLSLDDLRGTPGALSARFSAPGLAPGATITLSCTANSDGQTHSVSGTQSPLLLSGLTDGERYTCVLTGGGLTSAAVSGQAGAPSGVHAIPSLSAAGSAALALLLALVTGRLRRRS